MFYRKSHLVYSLRTEKLFLRKYFWACLQLGDIRLVSVIFMYIVLLLLLLLLAFPVGFCQGQIVELLFDYILILARAESCLRLKERPRKACLPRLPRELWRNELRIFTGTEHTKIYLGHCQWVDWQTA